MGSFDIDFAGLPQLDGIPRAALTIDTMLYIEPAAQSDRPRACRGSAGTVRGTDGFPVSRVDRASRDGTAPQKINTRTRFRGSKWNIVPGIERIIPHRAGDILEIRNWAMFRGNLSQFVENYENKFGVKVTSIVIKQGREPK